MITFQQIIIYYTEFPSNSSYPANIIGLDELFSGLAVLQVDPSAILGAEKVSGYACGVGATCRRFRSISEESPIVELERDRGLLPTMAAMLTCIICPVSTVLGLLVRLSCGTAVAVPINAVTVTREIAIVK
jgi:hypothetical protein